MPIITKQIKTPAENVIYSVTSLNKSVKGLLENKFGSISIEGEISNLVKASSGHYYFKLKDAGAQIQCAFFRFQAIKCSITLENGIQIQARAKVSLYEARGDYQLIIDKVEPAGIGQLQLAFDNLKKKLHAQGLFDKEHKQELPHLPHTIGIITSEKAAALRDIISTLKRRFKAINILLYPTDVQGDKAAPTMVKQLNIANLRKECDVLLLARGGGSIEDLWAFNDEKLAHAIFNSKLPIITGIGHEIDFTIADFCADLRAATPTAAAECASPNASDYLDDLNATTYFLSELVTKKIYHYQTKLNYYHKRLKAPEHIIYQQYQRLDKLQASLNSDFRHLLQQQSHKLLKLKANLIKENPKEQLLKKQQQLLTVKQRLITSFCHQFNQRRITLSKISTLLDATSPLATLDRGYALALTEKNKVITSSKDLAIGDTFWVKLKKDQLYCELKDIKS